MKYAKQTMALLSAAACLVSLTACGGNSTSSSSGSNSSASGKITVWGWGQGMDELVKGFEKAHPGIKVKYSNTGTASETATALQNAISAGSGAPDVCMLQGTDVSQFAIGKGIKDLSSYGADKLAKDYSQGAWRKLLVNGKPYGMPIDSGPMVFLYNKAVFDKAGVNEPPKTWDEYYEDAKKIHALGENYYITNNSGNKDSYSEFNAQLWQAGAKPYTVNGDKISIDLTGSDKSVKKVIDFQQKLIDEGLVNTSIGNWSDDWNRAMNDGSIASLVIGAWMPINLEKGAPDQKGNWRAAPIPQWDEESRMSSEDGGSALTIPEQTKNSDAAWTFVEYETHGAGAQIMTDTGTFPSLLKILNSKKFTDEKNEYFGGQQINKVFSEAANLKVSNFQFLPFSAYAQSIYGDQISPAYQKKTTLDNALKQYQEKLIAYGKQQGYEVK